MRSANGTFLDRFAWRLIQDSYFEFFKYIFLSFKVDGGCRWPSSNRIHQIHIHPNLRIRSRRNRNHIHHTRRKGIRNHARNPDIRSHRQAILLGDQM